MTKHFHMSPARRFAIAAFTLIALSGGASAQAWPEEAGVPDYVVTSFFGVVAPAATPADIIDKLNREINAALQTPQLQTAMAKLGAQTANETPPQFAAFIAAELAKWTNLSNSAGIKVA